MGVGGGGSLHFAESTYGPHMVKDVNLFFMNKSFRKSRSLVLMVQIKNELGSEI